MNPANNDPDLIQAAEELDAEFPGAFYDISLHKYHEKKELKKRRNKKIVLYAVFFFIFTAGVSLLFGKFDFISLSYGVLIASLVFFGFFYTKITAGD